MKTIFITGLLVLFPAVGHADATYTHELLGETEVPIHDFYYQGDELKAVTGGGCGEECTNGKSSIHNINTMDWSTTVVAAVPDAAGLPGAVHMDGALYAISGYVDEERQIFLRLNPNTGEIEQDYGAIYFAVEEGYNANWCQDLDVVSGRFVVSCWGALYELYLDGDVPTANKIWEDPSNSWGAGMVVDSADILWLSWCNTVSDSAHIISFPDIWGADVAPVFGPTVSDQMLFMALGHHDGELIGGRYAYNCNNDAKNGSWPGDVYRLSWEGDYPSFANPLAQGVPSIPVPLFPTFALLVLICLAGLFGVRRLR